MNLINRFQHYAIENGFEFDTFSEIFSVYENHISRLGKKVDHLVKGNEKVQAERDELKRQNELLKVQAEDGMIAFKALNAERDNATDALRCLIDSYPTKDLTLQQVYARDHARGVLGEGE